MLAEIGTFAIILALILSLMQSLSYANFIPNDMAKLSAFGQLIFLTLAMLMLIAVLLKNDFTVTYVIQHSHSTLPLIYKIGAAWGGHEGSLLLWSLILATWNSIFAVWGDKRQQNKKFHLHTLAIIGLITSGFLSFLLFTSNPFARNFQLSTPIGFDLTPVLQDIGLIFHPPLLYLGYVGFVISYSYALTVLINNNQTFFWAKNLRLWVLIPWVLLGFGIILGSHWSYRELGWGGWWFWDPVENASLMPWLAATALIHSLIVTEKRQQFAAWSVFLSLLTFSLSLLGTFLVRSGVLISVHAFATDPTRGIFLLCYLAIIIGGGFLIFAYRASKFSSKNKFTIFSRENLLLYNTLIQLTAIITLLLGTLYPIILDALQLEKISVGEPYFTTIFTPLMLALLTLMIFAPKLKWGQSKILTKNYSLAIFSGLIIAIIFPIFMGWQIYFTTTLGLTIACALVLITFHHMKINKPSAMVIAHIGIAITAIGIIINKSYSQSSQFRVYLNQTINFARYKFNFTKQNSLKKSNYLENNAKFTVKFNGKKTGNIIAKERTYTAHNQTLAHPGILKTIWADLYVAPGNRYTDGSWTFRFYYRPFVRWIWFGAIIILIGGIISIKKRLTNIIKPT